MSTVAYSAFTLKSPPVSGNFVVGLNPAAGSDDDKNVRIPVTDFAILSVANTFGDFNQTFKDNRILIESPNGLTPITIVNSQQTLARNLTIGILTGNRTIVTTGESSQITIGTEVTGAITNLSDVTAKTGTGTTAVFSTSPTLVTPALGTPSALVLTNATGLPPAGVTGVAAVQTDNLSVFAATTSAQLAGVISDETGSGLLVFGTSPTIVTPTIASFTNATHNHQAAAGGSTLVATLALTATGTKDSTTFLRGDDTWAVPAGGGDMVLASVQTVTGAKTFGTIGGAVDKFILAGSTSGSTILNAAAVAGSTTLTLPVVTDTLAVKGTNVFTANQTIQAVIPILTLDHNVILGDGATLSRLNMDGLSDTSAAVTYASISSAVVTDVNTAENGSIFIRAIKSGTITSFIGVNFTDDTIGIPPAVKFMLDGVLGTGNTFIEETSADFVTHQVGGEAGLRLQETGTEVNVVIGADNALATTATDGFLYISSMAGVPTGNPTDYTAKNPVVWDSTNSKFMLNTTGTTWVEIGGGGSGNTFARIVKKTDETVSNSTTLQDDDEITFTPTINKTYCAMLYLLVDSPSAQDIKIAWSVPTGCTVTSNSANTIIFRTTIAGVFGTDATTAVTIPTTGVPQSAGWLYRFKMSSTAGDITLQWAQVVALSVDTKVLEGATLVIWEEKA